MVFVLMIVMVMNGDLANNYQHMINCKWWSGWWYTYPSEKYEFVSWDHEIPNIWKIKVMFQTTNQLINNYLPIFTIINHH